MYGTGLGLERREGCIGKVQVREKRKWIEKRRMNRMGLVLERREGWIGQVHPINPINPSHPIQPIFLIHPIHPILSRLV